eukprot:427858-Rhodomonas_salina.1
MPSIPYLVSVKTETKTERSAGVRLGGKFAFGGDQFKFYPWRELDAARLKEPTIHVRLSETHLGLGYVFIVRAEGPQTRRG